MLNIITIKVNGHGVKVTTDQEITDQYLQTITDHVKTIENPKLKPKALSRKEKDQAMKDLGLIKVRGALGGVYYE